MNNSDNKNLTRTMDITPSPKIYRLLSRQEFELWQCLAELIDNSVDENVSKSQALNYCAINKYKTYNGKSCIGVIKKNDNYKYIYNSKKGKELKVGKDEIEKIWIIK